MANAFKFTTLTVTAAEADTGRRLPQDDPRLAAVQNAVRAAVEAEFGDCGDVVVEIVVRAESAAAAEPSEPPPSLDREGGFLTYQKDGVTHCLGYLFARDDGRVYDAEYGLLADVDKAAADVHNRLYDRALMEGLDHCQVGQSGVFYFNDDAKQVKTWLGTVVAAAAVRGRVITFVRGGRLFRGRRNSDDESVVFTRVS